MKSYLECIPCFAKQTLEAAHRVTDDTTVQEWLLRTVLKEVSAMNLNDPPPLMGQRIHRWIREKTGIVDPYASIKRESTKICLELFPVLRDQVNQSVNPLETAIRFAIAGNIIDLGANSHFDNGQIHQSIEESLSRKLLWEPNRFFQALNQADRILYLADNAGELVFDRLLIECCSREKITVAVRGFPILNDATMETAKESGLTENVGVISNGSDAPGTILDDCSESFLKHFDQADLIVAKGQGNYESLSDSRKNIVFLLKAKCPVIAADIGCHVGDLIAQFNHRCTTSDPK